MANIEQLFGASHNVGAIGAEGDLKTANNREQYRLDE